MRLRGSRSVGRWGTWDYEDESPDVAKDERNKFGVAWRKGITLEDLDRR